VNAGEVIAFQPGQPSTAVLQHTKLRAVIAEFLAPANTGIGKSLGYLVWREILTAISDQAGAGVILAHTPGSSRLVDLLQENYHEAALKVAREQTARMALWGAVLEENGHVLTSVYLSILPEAQDTELMLRIVSEPPLGVDLAAEIPRTRFNFPIVETRRELLFKRRVVARKNAVVRAIPAANGRSLAQPVAGTVLDTEDMEQGWFKLRLTDRSTGYINSSAVDVPPPRVEVTVNNVELRASPSPRAVGTRVNLSGSYPVLNMRYIGGSGLWYEIDASSAHGWLPAGLVRPRFSLPAVHFVAGLYRYQLGRYDDAQREFTQYLGASSVEADNTSLATAYQLLGASQLAGINLLKSMAHKNLDKSIDAFSRAVDLTPYDPAAYNLRALSLLMRRGRLREALSDLEKAIKLDPDNARARTLISALMLLTHTRQRVRFRDLVDADDEEVRLRLERIIAMLDLKGRPLRIPPSLAQ
jgi:hypothetical protein